MADQNQVETAKQGTAAWNTWRKQHSDVELDLSSADLSSADLSSAYLLNANLSNANLCNADLRGANLIGAHLRGAHLGNADLRGTLRFSRQAIRTATVSTQMKMLPRVNSSLK